ncbi:hypothetical protein TTHERM_01256560 (macronuclear) [Tetrahymena thermophila SB210]|uniref:Uncharacterized protein n=1 Tax=Tetrahymena thermophila (strain SB210) TaxID=312017 RepID=Q239L1_TETTS|nr:hypothetical protein TTHERM_01256560 [Tetrahymena thermophila SB210]EAR93218.1 hypothetical protein TTHERM_01256560 [Tetrahymena thermophila SB210]|eukprot:XP_001013463.1 hypothetical protein TTHERM_01256560 [Tetrahymena thermophila SB210]
MRSSKNTRNRNRNSKTNRNVLEEYFNAKQQLQQLQQQNQQSNGQAVLKYLTGKDDPKQLSREEKKDVVQNLKNITENKKEKDPQFCERLCLRFLAITIEDNASKLFNNNEETKKILNDFIQSKDDQQYSNFQVKLNLQDSEAEKLRNQIQVKLNRFQRQKKNQIFSDFQDVTDYIDELEFQFVSYFFKNKLNAMFNFLTNYIVQSIESFTDCEWQNFYQNMQKFQLIFSFFDDTFQIKPEIIFNYEEDSQNNQKEEKKEERDYKKLQFYIKFTVDSNKELKKPEKRQIFFDNELVVLQLQNELSPAKYFLTEDLINELSCYEPYFYISQDKKQQLDKEGINFVIKNKEIQKISMKVPCEIICLNKGSTKTETKLVSKLMESKNLNTEVLSDKIKSIMNEVK